MNRTRSIVAIVALAAALSGCMAFGKSPQPAAVAGSGALAGGLAGTAIEQQLDANDRRVAMDAEFRALEYGRPGAPVQWRGHTGRYYGDVVVGARYEVNDFACRDYTHTIYVDNQPQVIRGTACRQGDGTWKAIG